MSSSVPKDLRVWGGKKPSSFHDIDKRVQFLSKIISVVVGPCRIVGSYAESYPALDSDIDISIDDFENIKNHKLKVDQISELFGVKIDLCHKEGGFYVIMSEE